MRRWFVVLGYRFAVYVHERADVVLYRVELLDRMQFYFNRMHFCAYMLYCMCWRAPNDGVGTSGGSLKRLYITVCA